jgi:hypothetical protein
LAFQPNGTQGTSNLRVFASDGQLSSTNTINLTVGSDYVLTVSEIDDVSMAANQTRTVSFTVTGPNGSAPVNPVVTATASNSGLVNRVTTAGSGTNFTATIVLVANQSGTSTVTITAVDDFGAGSTSFGLTVTASFPPVLGPIPNQSTTTNVPVIVPLSVTDQDTPLTALIYTWTTTDTNVVRNVQFGLSGGTNVVATILPRGLGVAIITITIDDGTSRAIRSFQFTVAQPQSQPPVLGPIADQTTTINTPVVITLDVTDPDTSIQNLQFTSTTSNPGLVSGVTVNTSTGSAVATVNLVQNASGIATVTITVSDGSGQSSRTFALSVSGEGGPVIAEPEITQVGGVATINITWTGGGQLETAPSPTGPWTATGNSSGSFSEPVTGTAKFYRIRR